MKEFYGGKKPKNIIIIIIFIICLYSCCCIVGFIIYSQSKKKNINSSTPSNLTTNNVEKPDNSTTNNIETTNNVSKPNNLTSKNLTTKNLNPPASLAPTSILYEANPVIYLLLEKDIKDKSKNPNFIKSKESINFETINNKQSGIFTNNTAIDFSATVSKGIVISFWLYCKNMNDGSILYVEDDDTLQPSIIIYILDKQLFIFLNKFIDAKTDKQIIPIVMNIDIGKWNHIYISYDYKTNLFFMKIGSNDIKANLKMVELSYLINYSIGYNGINSIIIKDPYNPLVPFVDLQKLNSFEGNIRNFIIFDTILTEDQINKLYNEQL
jgi:hypothetical protein